MGKILVKNNLDFNSWTVSLDVNLDETCTVTIHGCPSELGGEFAFVL